MNIRSAYLETSIWNISQTYETDLRVKNPLYTAQKRFSRYKVTAPEYIYFFEQLPNDRIRVPRNYAEVISVNKTSQGTPISGDFRADLRSEQVSVIDEVKEHAKEGFTDFLLNVDTGKGKTVMSLYLIHLFGRKTLFVVPNRKLGDQFIDRCKEFTTYRAGWEGKGEFDIHVATYQLLGGTNTDENRTAKPERFYQKFGHLVLDEYHRAGSSQFHIVNTRAGCKYRTCLTATFNRKDKMESVLQYHFQKTIRRKETDRSHIVVKPILIKGVENLDFNGYNSRSTPFSRLRRGDLVHLPNINKNGLVHDTANRLVDLGGGELYEVTPGEKVLLSLGFSFPKFDTHLSENEEVLENIAREILQQEGRNILVLSNRINMLIELEEYLRDDFKTGLILSKGADEMKNFLALRGETYEQHEEYCSKEAELVFGINSLAKEGMDVARLDTLFILSGITDVEQALGRIERSLEGKPHPRAFYALYGNTNYDALWHKKGGARENFKKLGVVIA